MRVKFINKNSDAWFDIDEGSVLELHKDETLDSGTIKISNLFERLDVEPFDEIVFDSFYTKHLCVDTPVEVMNNIKPKTYSYEITVFSCTKRLEGILLPSLKITRLKEKDRVGDEQVNGRYTVWHYLSQYLTEYGEHIRVETGTNTWSWQSRWHFADRVQTRFNAIECPEMQWNTPTLREVFNALMMVDDCIVVLNGNEIDYMDLTEINDDITDDAHINYVTRSRSSEDYVSSLRMNMVNVTNEKSDKIQNYVTRSEYFSFTTDNAILTSDNIVIKTQLPIYNLKKLELIYYGKITYYYDDGVNPPGNNYYMTILKADLLKMHMNGHELCWVYEEKEWETKKIRYQQFDDVLYYERPGYKNYTLYYTRGSNVIQGFDQSTKVAFYQTDFLINMLRKYVAISDEAIAEVNENTYIEDQGFVYAIENPEPGSYYNAMFYIEYETLEGNVFEASKGDYPNHRRVVQDNQTNSYVDSYSQGALEYMKVNRLGNLQKMINARYFAGETPLQLGDIYEDSVIYSIQMQIYKHHVEVNAQATKDYILRNYYTGIKAKLRSWEIVSGSEALTRHDLLKYYCELSYHSHIDDIGDVGNYTIASYLTTPFIQSNTIAPLKYCLVQTYDESANAYPAGNDWYSMDMVSRIVGNSITFTFCFQDNYWVDKYVDRDESNISRENYHMKTAFVSGLGLPTQYYRYADDSGENYGGELKFCSELDPMNDEATMLKFGEAIYDEGTGVDKVNALKHLIAASYARPKVPIAAASGIKLGTPFNFIKDSQEITNLTTQFEFCTDTTDIAFTKAFIERQEAVRTVNNNHTFKAYLSNKYNFRDIKELPDDVSNAISVSISTTSLGSNSSLQLNISFQDDWYVYPADALSHVESLLEDYDTIYITDENDIILLALHNCDNIAYTGSAAHYYGAVYFIMNVLRDRNKNIYKSDKLTIKNKI